VAELRTTRGYKSPVILDVAFKAVIAFFFLASDMACFSSNNAGYYIGKNPSNRSLEYNNPASTTITTLLFDIDDTMYDVGTGFTAHRNGWGAQSFMVEKLHFPTYEAAKAVRDEYFERYHSTVKSLTIAEQEGRFPPLPDSHDISNANRHRFDPNDLAEWWAERLDYSLLRTSSEEERDEYSTLREILSASSLRLVAFTNSPKRYALRVLKELRLEKYFPPSNVFAVDDTFPHCKPETEAFQKVMDAVGVKTPQECVIIEDSMKNIRKAKSLGMYTVLVVGRRRSHPLRDDLAAASELTKPGDAPNTTDPAVDYCIEHCGQLKDALPWLWEP
jgi:putative hydrolase of the HAD superfamily